MDIIDLNFESDRWVYHCADTPKVIHYKDYDENKLKSIYDEIISNKQMIDLLIDNNKFIKILINEIYL